MEWWITVEDTTTTRCTGFGMRYMTKHEKYIPLIDKFSA